MDSRTKRTVTLEQLQGMVHAAFGPEQQIIESTELKEGWYNAVYAIRLSGGMDTILKIAPSPYTKVMNYEQQIMRTEVEVTTLLKVKTTIPLPNIYYASVDEGEEMPFFFMSKLEGAPYNLVKETIPDDEKQSIERQIGEYSRLINQIRGTSYGYYNFPEWSKWSEAFKGMIASLLQDAYEVDCPLPFSPEQLQLRLEKYAAAFDAVKEPHLVYWDLWDGNVLVRDDKVTGIIDAERALWGDPLMEYRFNRLAANTEAFFEGYEYRFEQRDERVRRKFYDLYFGMILVIESRYRGFSQEHEDQMRQYLLDSWNLLED